MEPYSSKFELYSSKLELYSSNLELYGSTSKKKLGFLNFWGWKKLLAYFCDAECEIGFLKILFQGTFKSENVDLQVWLKPYGSELELYRSMMEPYGSRLDKSFKKCIHSKHYLQYYLH